MARKVKHTAPVHDVTIEKNGTTYTGFYTVEAGMVTVRALYGTRTTQIGGSTAGVVARMLLRELVDLGIVDPTRPSDGQ